ncbi:MAG: hypothetical protein M0D57_06310 [Sphingobacteriales bacterium JAD_PAG50586_3]|nr:MAG: hypothetical protein M0D57_06310 [Sphingobacteriales bacterium JAD_PAG50586_3]
MEEGGGWEYFVADYGTWLVMGLLVLAIVLVIFFSILQVVVNRKANLKPLMGAGVLVAVFLVSWLLAPAILLWTILIRASALLIVV